MKIKLRLFAYLREQLDGDMTEIEVPEGATAGMVWSSFIAGRVPPNSRFRVCFAVNGEHAGEQQALRDGDELAFMPPISGG